MLARVYSNTFLHGLLYTRASMILRRSYLCGQYSNTGWWYYFPLAMLFKTPLATLAAIAVAAVCAIAWLAMAIRTRGQRDYWTWLCLGFPAAFYMAAAMHSNLNIGLRHVFPVYPFLFIAAGVVFAKLDCTWPMQLRAMGALLAIGLATETFLAYPNYIPFFNAPSTAYGRIRLLGDSNVDWGQDLPLLADWQKKNPNRKLFVCYFGMVYPSFYGIRYTPLPGSIDYKSEMGLPQEPGVWAISATHLQGILMTPAMREFYGQFWHERKPLAVLGESIYLYEVGTAVKGE